MCAAHAKSGAVLNSTLSTDFQRPKFWAQIWRENLESRRFCRRTQPDKKKKVSAGGAQPEPKPAVVVSTVVLEDTVGPVVVETFAAGFMVVVVDTVGAVVVVEGALVVVEAGD